MSEGPSRRSFLKGAAAVATGPCVPVLPALGTRAEAVSAAAKSIAEAVPTVAERPDTIIEIFRLCEFLMTDLNCEIPSMDSIVENYCLTFGLKEVYIDKDIRFKITAIAEFLNYYRKVFPNGISQRLMKILEGEDFDGFGDECFREKRKELATDLKDVMDMLGIAPENVDQLFNIGTQFVRNHAHKLTTSDLVALGDDTINSLVGVCPDLDLPNIRAAQIALRENEQRERDLCAMTQEEKRVVYRHAKEVHEQLFKGFKIIFLHTYDKVIVRSMAEKGFDPKKDIYEFLFDREVFLDQGSVSTGRAQLQKSIYMLFQRKLPAEDFSKFCSNTRQVRIVPIIGKHSPEDNYENHNGFYVQFTDPNYNDTFKGALGL